MPLEVVGGSLSVNKFLEKSNKALEVDLLAQRAIIVTRLGKVLHAHTVHGSS